MGYYSEVAIALKKEDWERLKEEAAKSEAFKDVKGGMTKLWNQISLVRDEFVVLYASCLKWYDICPDVKFIMNFFSQIEHEYLRVGEEFGDSDYENTFEKNYYDSFFYPSASISFAF